MDIFVYAGLGMRGIVNMIGWLEMNEPRSSYQNGENQQWLAISDLPTFETKKSSLELFELSEKARNSVICDVK